MTVLTTEYKWVDGQGPAFGGPGLEPRWTSSAKDTVGTAYSASSRVWYTVSHGILNEVYYPTIDRPQIRDMEFLITDGMTFFHEEKRALSSKIEYIDNDALAVRITSTDPDGRYTLIKEIISDPHHPVVIINVRLEGHEELLSRLKVYALLAPHLEGGGAGNSARILDVAGKVVGLAWKNNTSLAMAADCGFTRASCGYVGSSDGWQDLQNYKMDWQFGSALDGNISLLGEIDAANHHEFTLAIGFGEGHHAAISGAMGSLTTPFELQLKRFIEQWRRAPSPKNLAGQSGDGGRLLLTSHHVLLAHEDKLYSGAFIASASIPWGSAKSDEDLGGYHLVWTRDMVQTATALLACGRIDTARRALVYLACTQKPDGGFAQNFWIDGTPYWTGMQLDEVAFPIVLAWRLWQVDGLAKFDVFPFVERAAAFLVAHAPITQQERWEENSGYSPSTLAAVIAGLICAAEIARARDAVEVGERLEQHADWIESHLDEWTVTEDGVLLPEVKRHYMRIRPPQPGESYARDDAERQMVHISNRGPGEQTEFEARELIDGGFLELVRYGIRSANDPLIVDSLKVVDAVLKVDTPYGTCWRRYNHDGYGQRHDGGPYLGWGQGRAWPLLTGERAHYELAAGGDIKAHIAAIEAFASAGGMLPEQIWDAPPMGHLELGRPTGSAMPLVWAHSEYLKLLRSAADGVVYDIIAPVARRYAGRKSRSSIEVFTLGRPVQQMEAGKSLRFIAQQPFQIHWTTDGWATVNAEQCGSYGYSAYHTDLKTATAIPPSNGSQQNGRLSFTLFWQDENRWEGRNFDVTIVG
ncbi:MAG TPA: glycoside hydrolase family 15 protein [Acidisarcina sp.]